MIGRPLGYPPSQPSRSPELLRPYQQIEHDYLSTRTRAANWSEAGLGKTRPTLLSARGKTLVIAPGAIRDTLVWPREAERIGVEPPEVISYHKAAQGIGDYHPDTLILDEAEHVDNLVVTPQGYKRIGDIRVGDEVIGADGCSTRVIGVRPRGTTDLYRVTMRDGCYVDCSPNHLWQTTRAGARPINTLQLKAAVEKPYRSGAYRLRSLSGPVSFCDVLPLPMHPYLLGYFLGNGSMSKRTPWMCMHQDDADWVRVTLGSVITADEHLGATVTSMNKRGVRISICGGITASMLDQLGLRGTRASTKFIPDIYMRASACDRYALLRGLMDSDGCSLKRPGMSATYATTSISLATQIAELVRSLGGSAKRYSYASGCHYIWIVTPECPFSLPRKVARWQPRRHHYRAESRVVTSVEYIGTGETVCIQVDNPDGLYVTGGAAYIVTHNSQWVKERKVSWGDPIFALAQRTEVVYQATGTPMPNGPMELWGQFRMLWPAGERRTKYYWPWIESWFEPAPTRYSAYNYSNRLLGCRCPDDEIDSCKHWDEFYQANIEGYAVRHLRDEVMSDLPPLDGQDDPLWTPMTTQQRRLYTQLQTEMLAQVPEEGITIEALTDSGKFTMLHKLSSGLSVLDPAADPKDKQSGKIAWLREYLRDLHRPVLIVCWFKQSAQALSRVCTELGMGHAVLGTLTSPKQRLALVDRFGTGQLPVLIASLSVIKEGVDGLQYGSDEVILFERSWVPGPNDQVIRRLHRLGQARPVTARQLVTPRTADALQWRTVHDKTSEIRRVLRPAELATRLKS